MKNLVLCAVLLFLLNGCSAPGGPETFPATGSVTMKGEPVAGALVVFTPQSADDETRLASQAETDETGSFEMQTFIGEGKYKAGIVPGEYVVTVTKLEVVQDMRSKPKHLLPKKYHLPRTSDLTAVVKADGENAFSFELK